MFSSVTHKVNTEPTSMNLGLDLLKLAFLFLAVILFLDVPSYWFATGVVGKPPLYFILSVIVLASLSVIVSLELSLSRALMYWSIFYISITFLWLLFVGDFDADVKEAVELKILMILFLLSINYVLVSSYKVLKVFQKLLILVTLLVVTLNVLEILGIYSLFSKGSFFLLEGRAAAFYINPNTTGAAIIVSIILSISVVPSRFRDLYVFAGLVGVLLTGSRSALLVYLLLILAFVIFDFLDKKRFVLIIAGLSLLIISSLPWVIDYFYTSDLSLVKQIESRVVTLTSGGEFKDDSAEERIKVAETAWQLFQEKPFLGHGIETSIGNMTVGTHNMYLDLMIDHGIIGFFIMPLLFFLIYFESGRETRKLVLIFSFSVLLLGLFTHNLLDRYYMIIAYATLAAMAVHSADVELEKI